MTTASVVTHCTQAHMLATLLSCLRRERLERIYVIDNSPDTRLKAVTEGMDNVEYRHVVNRGYGAGHNVAITAAMELGSRYHLVLNPDVRWDGEVIAPLRRYMEEHPETGHIMPKVFYPDGRLQEVCRMLPTPYDQLLRGCLPKWFDRRRRDDFSLLFTGYDRVMNVPSLLGSFMFFRMDALRDVGLFDERYFMYFEDIDITRRIHKKWHTTFYPEVSIVHDHARASRKSLTMFRVHVINMIRYFNKWGWIGDTERREFNKRLEVYRQRD